MICVHTSCVQISEINFARKDSSFDYLRTQDRNFLEM